MTESVSSIAVCGLAGIDFLLNAENAFNRGTKIGVSLSETPGYFVLNVASHLCAERIATTLITVLGDDAVAGRIEEQARTRDVRLVAARIAGRSTPMSYVLIENGARTIFRLNNSAAGAWTKE